MQYQFLKQYYAKSNMNTKTNAMRQWKVELILTKTTI